MRFTVAGFRLKKSRRAGIARRDSVGSPGRGSFRRINLWQPQRSLKSQFGGIIVRRHRVLSQASSFKAAVCAEKPDRREPKFASQVLAFASLYKEEMIMRPRLAISALVATALFGAMAIASAQMQPAPGASSQGNAGPGAGNSNTKPGMTTGSASTKAVINKGVARNPATDNNSGTGRGK